MNDFQKVYEIMNRWKSRFPNVECVSIFLFHDELRIRVDWQHPTQFVSCVKVFTVEELDVISVDLEEAIMQDMENDYMKWEVGEE